ncbi:MAG: zinc-dependent alcohol dehydrogenase family protein [Candidatus Binatia bacterium]
MRAMIYEGGASGVVRAVDLPVPQPGPGQVLVRVRYCGVCRTDLHVVDGDLGEAKLPLVPGHEIVGVVERLGDGVAGLAVGEPVGVAWLGGACGTCAYCTAGRENLCAQARYTGYQIDGGYAEYTVADARYCFRLPAALADAHGAPLLCAGLIGHRAYRMAGDGRRLGLYGFGAAAHIVTQEAVWEGREVYAFTRSGDDGAQRLARELGAVWAGSSAQAPPEPLEAAILFAPIGALVPAALAQVVPGGVVVCAGIHMSDIPAFPYRLLWGERIVRSVANLTRRDGRDFLAIAPQVPVRTHIARYALEDANRALDDLRAGRFSGAAVLQV